MKKESSMKHLLCSLALVTVLLVGTSGAWALTIIDTYNAPLQTPPALPGDMPGPTAVDTSAADCSNVLGCFRQIQVGNALALATAPGDTRATVDKGDSNVAALASGPDADGRILMRWEGGSPNSLNENLYDSGDSFRFVITNLNRFLFSAITICAGSAVDTTSGVAEGDCFTDEFSKPASSDTGPASANPAVGSPSVSASPGAPCGLGATDADCADHFIDSTAVNFVDRAHEGSLDVNHATGAYAALTDADNDQVRAALHSVGSIQLIIRVDDGRNSQTNINGFDVSIDCFEVTDHLGATTCHSPSPIPEPATITLMGLGMAGLGLGAFLRRRGQKA